MGTADGTVVGATKIIDRGPDNRRFNLVLISEGYTPAQLPQFATDANNFVATLAATPPFSAMAAAINVYRIDVSSTDSGADDPVSAGGTGATARTYFDATFGNGGVRRALVVNDALAIQTANAHVSTWHMLMVIVNSPIYGGTGGSVAVFSLASNANEIGLHEMGHTAFHLADEYEYLQGCGLDTTHNNHPAGEPGEPNVTLNTNRDTIKWRPLIAPTTAMPTMANPNCSNCDGRASTVPAGTVGAFEGAHYYHCGAYRPEYNCRMRALQNPFCAVCTDVIQRTLTPFLPSMSNAGIILYDRSAGEADVVGFNGLGAASVDRTNRGWRRSWTELVVGGFLGNGHHQLVLYDREAGEADVVGFDIHGSVNLDRTNRGWRRSWDMIVAGNFVSTAREQLVLYDRTAGEADVVGFDGQGAANLDHTNRGWRRSWDIIVAGKFVGNGRQQILLYDRSAGEADVVGFDGQGAANVDHTSSGWRRSWDMIVVGDFLGNGRQQILLYDRSAGEADVVGFDGKGVVNVDHTNRGWRRSWDSIVVGDFLGNGRQQILLYDRSAGEADVVGFDGHGAANLDRTNRGWRRSWDRIIAAPRDTFL